MKNLKKLISSNVSLASCPAVMSYRELRNFVERMKTLGYHRLISMDNFRTPNFELVADILYWLVKRYDPTTDLSDDISTETQRVDFLKSVAQIMSSKAQIKLKIAQLYRADGFAVRELLKIADLLYKATTVEINDENKNINTDLSLLSKIEELKEARSLSSEIVDSGSKLYSLLATEEETKRARDNAVAFLETISKNLDNDDAQLHIERSIRMHIQEVIDQSAEKRRICAELEADKQTLTAKISKKQEDLERQEKRLKSLTQVRPAFMEEYEVLEHELKGVYETYIERFRNLSYLESELAQQQQMENEKLEESNRALKKLQKKLREEELRILRGELDAPQMPHSGGGSRANLFDDDDDDIGGGGDDDDDDGFNAFGGHNQNNLNTRNRQPSQFDDDDDGFGARPVAANTKLRGRPSEEDLQDRVHGSMELDNDDGSSSGGSGLSDLSNDDDDNDSGLGGDDDRQNLDDDDEEFGRTDVHAAAAAVRAVGRGGVGGGGPMRYGDDDMSDHDF